MINDLTDTLEERKSIMGFTTYSRTYRAENTDYKLRNGLITREEADKILTALDVEENQDRIRAAKGVK